MIIWFQPLPKQKGRGVQVITKAVRDQSKKGTMGSAKTFFCIAPQDIPTSLVILSWDPPLCLQSNWSLPMGKKGRQAVSDGGWTIPRRISDSLGPEMCKQRYAGYQTQRFLFFPFHFSLFFFFSAHFLVGENREQSRANIHKCARADELSSKAWVLWWW